MMRVREGEEVIEEGEVEGGLKGNDVNMRELEEG